jgi:hypothetical protein
MNVLYICSISLKPSERYLPKIFKHKERKKKEVKNYDDIKYQIKKKNESRICKIK